MPRSTRVSRRRLPPAQRPENILNCLHRARAQFAAGFAYILEEAHGAFGYIRHGLFVDDGIGWGRPVALDVQANQLVAQTSKAMRQVGAVNYVSKGGPSEYLALRERVARRAGALRSFSEAG